MTWSDIDAIGGALIILSVPFVSGVIVGAGIVARRKQEAADEDARLGRQVAAIFGDMERTLSFTGPGMKVQRIGAFKRGKVECKITLEAEA